MIYRLQSVIDAPVAKVFAFHERPEALELLTPPGQKPEVLERTGGIRPGGRVVMRVPMGPFRVKWVALHTAYMKDRLFVDEQAEGPFRKWIHRHEFEALQEHSAKRTRPERVSELNEEARRVLCAPGEKTLYTDIVDFAFFGGPLTEWVVWLQLRAMFRHRHRAVANAMR